jgi:hypothetical protein
MYFNEAELVLIESLLHTERTRVEYFKNMAKEKGYSLPVFYLELSDAYNRLNNYVNSFDNTCWNFDPETGERGRLKNNISLFLVTGGKIIGTLTDENITDILPALYELGQIVIIDGKTKEYELLQKYKNILEQQKDTIIGNNSTKQKNLTMRQIALIYQYEKWPLTEGNAKEVLQKYYCKISKTSPNKLADTFRKFNTPSQRTGEGVKTANDIRKILPRLSVCAKELANNELELAVQQQSTKK